MSSSLVGLAHVLSVALVAAVPVAPVEWSRDSRWIAYTTIENADAPALPSGWMLAPGGIPEATASAPSPPRKIYRIWATQVKSGESVLIEESPHPLSSPSWVAAGRTLVYGRFAPVDGGGGSTQHGRYEVVVRTGLDHQRSFPIEADLELNAEDRVAIARQKLAPSPDGRRLAVPRPGDVAGLWLMNVADGRTAQTLDGAFAPAWSPDSRRLAFLKEVPVPEAEPAVQVHLLNSAGGGDQTLRVSASALSGSLLAWGQDGQSLMMIAGPGGGTFRTRNISLVRIGVDGGYASSVSTLESISPTNVPGRMRGQATLGGEPRPRSARVDLTMDAEQDQGVCLINDGQEQVMRWCSLVGQNTYDRFHPLDNGLQLGAPAIAPDGLTLAFRVDDGGGAGIVSLYDLTTKETIPVAPDLSSRRRWLDRLASCALDLLQTWLPSPAGDGEGVRATVLPILGELGGFHPRQFRLKRLAKFASAPLTPPAVPGDGLDDFRLFFAYLAQDYDAAERHLDAVESTAEAPRDRLRWMCLRAQILMSKGEVNRARGIVGYLERETRGSRFSIEESAGTYTLTAVDDPGDAWATHLNQVAGDGTLLRMGKNTNELGAPGETPDAINLGGWAPAPDQMPIAPFAPNPGDLLVPPNEFGIIPFRRRLPNLGDAPPPPPDIQPPGMLPRFTPPPVPGLRVVPLEVQP